MAPDIGTYSIQKRDSFISSPPPLVFLPNTYTTMKEPLDFGMIEVFVFTDDPVRRDIIERYWRCLNGSSFAEPLSSIEGEYGLTRGGILQVVHADSRAISKVIQCRSCDRMREFRSRKDFRETPTQSTFVCDKCSQEEGADESASAGQMESISPGQEQDFFKVESASAGGPSGTPEEPQKSRDETLRRIVRLLSRATEQLDEISQQLGNA